MSERKEYFEDTFLLDDEIIRAEGLFSVGCAIEDAMRYGPNNPSGYYDALSLLNSQMNEHKKKLKRLITTE